MVAMSFVGRNLQDLVAREFNGLSGAALMLSVALTCIG
jgi:hypothetical protein